MGVDFLGFRKMVSSLFLSVGLLIIATIALFVPPGKLATLAVMDMALRCLQFGTATAAILPNRRRMELGVSDPAHIGGMLLSWIGTIFTM